jgi:hypothetical protein
MPVHFVYCPKSGDRVFAEKPHTTISILRWSNRCRHVIGGCHLSYAAANAGSWWRTQAVRLATAIVDSVGGIAWDEQGTVHLIVPAPSAYQADRLVSRASPKTSSDERLENAIALSGIGCPLAPDLSSVSGPPRPYGGDPMSWYQIPRLRIERSQEDIPADGHTAYGLPIVTTVVADFGDVNGQPITCQVKWGGKHPPQLEDVDGAPTGSDLDCPMLSIERLDPDHYDTVRIVYAPTILHPDDAPTPENR